METASAGIVISAIVALTTLVLKFVPGPQKPEASAKDDEIADLNDEIDELHEKIDEQKERIVKVETRLSFHAETLDRFEIIFKEVVQKIDDLRRDLGK